MMMMMMTTVYVSLGVSFMSGWYTYCRHLPLWCLYHFVSFRVLSSTMNCWYSSSSCIRIIKLSNGSMTNLTTKRRFIIYILRKRLLLVRPIFWRCLGTLRCGQAGVVHRHVLANPEWTAADDRKMAVVANRCGEIVSNSLIMSKAFCNFALRYRINLMFDSYFWIEMWFHFLGWLIVWDSIWASPYQCLIWGRGSHRHCTGLSEMFSKSLASDSNTANCERCQTKASAIRFFYFYVFCVQLFFFSEVYYICL